MSINPASLNRLTKKLVLHTLFMYVAAFTGAGLIYLLMHTFGLALALAMIVVMAFISLCNTLYARFIIFEGHLITRPTHLQPASSEQEFFMKLRTQLRTHTLAQALFYACFLGIYALGNGLTFFALAFFVGTFAEEIAQWYWLYRIKFTGHLVVQLASWALLFTAVASTLLRTIPYFLAISPLVAIALTIAVVKVLQPLGLHKLILRNNL